MRKGVYIFCILILLLIGGFPVSSQTLIMNEISQGESGNMEYVEFVVVDTAIAYDCNVSTPPCADIRGWIFDDNSGYHGAGGIASGAVRFSFDAFWSCLPVGTIVLIYDDSDPNNQLPADDISMSDGNCAIVAPISNTTLFETNSTTPGAVACSYPNTGWNAGGDWVNARLRNSGDCARLVDLAGCEVFSVCWGDVNLNTQIYFAGGATSPISATNTVYYFNGNDPTNQTNWSIGCADFPVCGVQDQTPGVTNNAANAAYIAQFNNGCTPIPPLLASATSTDGCGCTGAGLASASGSIPGYTYQWYDNSFTSIGQSGVNATGLCVGTYHVMVTSSIGCVDTATITLNPVAGSNAGSAGALSTCINSGSTNLFNQLTGSPNTGGTWTGPSALTGADLGTFTPGTNIAGLYTYTVGTSPCISSAEVTVTVDSPLDPGTAGNVNLCIGDPNTDLFNALGGTPTVGGTWSPIMASGSGLFDPAIDAAGIYTYTVPANGACAASSQNVTVVINNCCTSMDTVDYDSFEYTGTIPDINPLSVYHTVPQSFAVRTGSSSVYMNFQNGFQGVAYDREYSVCIGQTYQLSAWFSNTWGGAPDVDLQLTIYDANNSILHQLTTLPIGGGWTQYLSSQFTATTNTIRFEIINNIAGGVGNNDCSMDDIVLERCTTPINNYGLASLCSNTATFNLIDSIASYYGNSGIWTGPSSLTGGYLGTFNPSSSLTGTYTYTISPGGSCPDSIANISITINPSPSAGTSASINFCSTDPPTDLFGLLGGTPDAGGTWSPALNSGTGLFDPSIDVAATYTYTVTGVSPCTDANAQIVVTVNNIADATITLSGPFCENDIPQTLAAATPGGSWSGVGITNTTSGTFDPTVAGPGAHLITYTISGTCGNTDTETFIVAAAPNAGISGNLTTCSNSGNSDLFTLLGGTPDLGGSWIPSLSSGSSIYNPTLDASGVYTYVVQGTAPCANDSSTITVIADSPLDAGLAGAVSFCSGDSPVDLFNSLGGTPDAGGVWSPALVSGTGVFDPSQDVPGVYSYTVPAVGACSGSSQDVTVSLTPGPDASIVPLVPNGLCANDTPLTIVATNAGGIWSGTGITDPVQGIFDPALSGAGTFYIKYVISGNCSDSDSIAVLVFPSVTMNVTGNDVVCFGQSTGSADAVLVSGSSPYTYLWDNSTGSQTTATATGLLSGSYFVTVTDDNGCSAIDSCNIFEPTELSIDSVQTFDPNCNSNCDGNAIINPSGGTTPYTYSISGGLGSGLNTATPSDLCGGLPYFIVVTDANGCTINEQFNLNEPLAITTIHYSDTSDCENNNGEAILQSVSGGTLLSGSAYTFQWDVNTGNQTTQNASNLSGGYYCVTITDDNNCSNVTCMNVPETTNPIANFETTPSTTNVANTTISFTDLSSSNVSSWQWSFFANDQLTLIGENNYAQHPTFTFPSDTGIYPIILNVTTPEGCTDSDTNWIKIEGQYLFYIPNAFTPNGDGKNDYFFPKGVSLDPDDFHFLIFNRWGALIFSSHHLSIPWDGIAHDLNGTEIVQEGVYVWKIQTNDLSQPGKRRDYTGHVTLIK